MSTTVTKTVPFHTFSAGSQEEADALALASARAQAEAQLECFACPIMSVVEDAVTESDPDWNLPSPGYHIVKFPFSATTGQTLNIFMDFIGGSPALMDVYILTPNDTVIKTQINAEIGDMLTFDVPTTGDYAIGFATSNEFPRLFSFHTDCAEYDMPCTLPEELDDTQWKLFSYSDGDIPLGGCTPEVTANPAWDGSFIDFFVNGGRTAAFWDADGSNFPSLFSIDGSVLAEADIFYSGCSGELRQAKWQLEIFLGSSFDLMWVGVKYRGDTPLGTYVKISGCATTPSGLTVIAL